MKIATYNVRNLYDPGTFVDQQSGEVVTEQFFTTRIEYFINQLRSLNVDVICLQEIGGELGIQKIAAALGYEHFSSRPNKRGIRVAVMYKKDALTDIVCESVSLGELHVPSLKQKGDTASLPPISQSRDFLHLAGLYNGTPVSIVTFHLKSNLPEYLEGDDMEHDTEAFIDAKFRCIFVKAMELCALRRFTESKRKEGREVVLLGDYNETTIGSTMDILKASQNRDVTDLYDTLHGYVGDAVTHYHKGQKLTFDTIIVSAGLKDMVKEVKIENTNLRDYSILPKGAIEHEVESDHALVYIEV
jgi:exonuclease III